MTLKDNVLLVEDERRWSEIYERAVRRVGFESVRAVTTFSDAEQAVDSMRFAVAVVDIGLHVDDDRNVDGLRVMGRTSTTATSGSTASATPWPAWTTSATSPPDVTCSNEGETT